MANRSISQHPRRSSVAATNWPSTAGAFVVTCSRSRVSGERPSRKHATSARCSQLRPRGYPTATSFWAGPSRLAVLLASLRRLSRFTLLPTGAEPSLFGNERRSHGCPGEVSGQKRPRSDRGRPRIGPAAGPKAPSLTPYRKSSQPTAFGRLVPRRALLRLGDYPPTHPKKEHRNATTY